MMRRVPVIAAFLGIFLFIGGCEAQDAGPSSQDSSGGDGASLSGDEACPDGGEGSECGDRARVELLLVALRLGEVGDVVWDVEVRGPDASVVSQTRLSSSLYGDGSGGVRYLGPCAVASDDAAGQNVVRVWLVGVYDGDVTSPGDFNTPGEVGPTRRQGLLNPTWVDTNGNGIRDPGDLDTPATGAFVCRPDSDAFVQLDVMVDARAL